MQRVHFLNRNNLARHFQIACLGFLIIMNSAGLFAVEIDDQLSLLEETYENREQYEKLKTERITNLSIRLDALRDMGEKELEYDLSRQLYLEYKSYMYDSAFKYVEEMFRLARELNDPVLVNRSKIDLGFTFLSSGLFKEALDTLITISSGNLELGSRIDYYSVLARTYYDLALYHNSGRYYKHYNRKGNLLLDSALYLMSDDSADYWLTMGQRRMKAGDFQGAADAYHFVLSKFEISKLEYAIATSSLGWINSMLGRERESFEMLVKAAISDIQSSTKETVAFRNIAIQLFQKGRLDEAYKYITISLDNATFYNARHRKIEIGEVLPIIEGKRISTLEKQKKQLMFYGSATTLLIVVVTFFVLAFYRQLKKVRMVKSILQQTNTDLSAINEALRESNRIKEEYIGQFFTINSEYLKRLESYHKTIRRKIISRQYEDLNDMIRSSELQLERKKLFDNFDHIFLKLFPNFIEEFNKLFKNEDQIVIEQGELLNPDLRIFALMRLGINDSEKIANFLNYSVNTIYTYKTKLKQKATVPKEEFDDYVMKIRSVKFISHLDS